MCVCVCDHQPFITAPWNERRRARLGREQSVPTLAPLPLPPLPSPLPTHSPTSLPFHSLARFQGGTKKEEQIDRSKIEKLAYGVGGHYLEEDCKVHVTSNDFVQDLAGSFYAMCASQVPPINLVDFRQKPKKKIAAGDRGEFDGYGWFSDPMERDRAVNILDNQRDGNNCTIIVSKFVHKSERGMK